jgi:four helix bundle protein
MASADGVRAWQAALEVAIRTRKLLEQFPKRGYAELKDQMIRSSESIGNNIAEGRASKFEREYIKYLDTAVRSASELSSQLRTVMAYGIVRKWDAFNLNGTVICTRRMTESLREAVYANYQAKLAAKRAKKKAPSRKKRKAP